MPLYDKGDIVWIEFPYADLRQKKHRPALVISNSTVNSTGEYVLLQITSKVKRDGFSVTIDNLDYDDVPLDLDSYVRLHKLFTADETIIENYETKVTASFLSRVIQQLNSQVFS